MKPTKIKMAPSRPTVVKKAKEIPAAPKPERKKPQVVCSEAVLKFETLAMPKGITLLPAQEKFNLEAILRERKALSKKKPFLEEMEEGETGFLVPEEELTYQDEYDYDYEEEEGLEEEEELEEMEEEELEEEVEEDEEEESLEEEDEDYRY